ncbi:MAG: hypothetical protein U0166_10120 [Acidobacteriota bacterium]
MKRPSSVILACSIVATRASAGTVGGAISVDGPVEPPAPLSITLDKDTCGTGTMPDPSLVVTPEGRVANAVVMILGPLQGTWKETEWKLDQKKCEFVPHIVVMPVGKKLVVGNSDGILHNFHTLCKVNAASNVAQPPAVKNLERTWDKPEAFRVECDVHSWMSAFIVVAENPFYYVTGADGLYRIDDLPDGKYTLAVVHEKLGRVEKPIEIKGNKKPLILDVALPAPPR